ncbi:hypothetical protein HW555_013690, partial [Spodoptera exigua]
TLGLETSKICKFKRVGEETKNEGARNTNSVRSDSANHKKNRPRPVTITLPTRAARNQWLATRKTHQLINDDVFANGNTHRIYISLARNVKKMLSKYALQRPLIEPPYKGIKRATQINGYYKSVINCSSKKIETHKRCICKRSGDGPTASTSKTTTKSSSANDTNETNTLLKILAERLQNKKDAREDVSEDGDRYFLLSLLNDFKRIPESRKMDAKYDIIGIIRKYTMPQSYSRDYYNLDSELYEQPGYFTNQSPGSQTLTNAQLQSTSDELAATSSFNSRVMAGVKLAASNFSAYILKLTNPDKPRLVYLSQPQYPARSRRERTYEILGAKSAGLLKFITNYVMDDSQLETWLHELDTEDEDVIESEDDEVEPEPNLQTLVRESELQENEEERSSEFDELSDSGNVPLSQLAPGRRGSVYKSTNGTIWHKDIPSVTRTRTQNIRLRPTGPKGNAARSAKDPLSCFELFFTQDILEILVRCTNIYLDKIKENFQRNRDAKPTDIGTGLEIVYATMSINRFRFLIRALRFDDITDRETRRKLDKMAPNREVVELVTKNCLNALVINQMNALPEKITRRNFLHDLSFNLIKPLLIRRASNTTLPRQLKFRIGALLDSTAQEFQEPQHDLTPKTGRVGRCAFCTRARSRSTKKWCKTCYKWICPNHQAVVCPECYEKNENSN